MSSSEETAAQRKRDYEWLMLQPQFLRFMFDTLATSGMWASTYGADGRHLALNEGRRSLGLDMLNTVGAGRADALLAIMQAGADNLMETIDDNRNRSRTRTRDRNADDLDDGKPVDRGPTSEFIAYGPSGT